MFQVAAELERAMARQEVAQRPMATMPTERR